MAFDKTRFLDQFRTETREHMQHLSDGLLKLEKEPEKKEVLETMMREAHTIKGSAAMMGYEKLANIAHGMEDGMEKALNGELLMDRAHFDLLFRCLDSMEPLLESNRPGEDRRIEMPVVEDICREIDEIFAGKGPELTKKKRDIGTSRVIKKKSPNAKKKTETRTAGRKEKGKPRSLPRAEKSIRVDIDRLDRLMNLSGEFGIARLRLKELLRTMLRKAESGEAVPDDVVSLLGDLSSVDEKIGSLTSNLQIETMGVRTVPVSYLFNTFPRAMRDLATKKGKEVEFEVRGKETQLDKGIIDELRDPLLHLLRNAVDHGMDTPRERLDKKKPERGRIVLSACQMGSQVVIEVSDDGRGIDREAVGRKAASVGLVPAEEIDTLSDDRIFQLIFTPNFSTSEELTETSGRGVGLDVVKDKLGKLKGTIEVESAPDRGTTFKLTLPLTLAIAESLLVASGPELFAVPLDNVVETVRISPEDITTVGGNEAIAVRGRITPLVRLNELFGLPMKGIVEKRFFPVVILQVLDRRAGLLVDELLGRQEIIRKSLGYPLMKVRDIAGATILGSGRVTLILDIPSILESLDGAERRGSVVRERPVRRVEKRRILVAEDSLSTATLEKEILESAGYSVALARDGQEAVDMAAKEDFDLIITDILMPRMDGFELTTRLKEDGKCRDIPVIIVTTRESDEDRIRGLEAGADAYILKSEFTSEELLGRIERLAG